MRMILVAIFSILTMWTAIAFADDESAAVAARKAHWQAAVEDDAYLWSNKRAGFVYSLAQFQGDCQVETLFDPADRQTLMFKVLRSGKEIIAVKGSFYSQFVGVKGAFYFADYPTGECGCRVVAFDTVTGVKLWSKKLEAAGTVPHSGYGNRIELNFIGDPRDPDVGETAIVVNGQEGASCYVEVLDPASGEQLAHRMVKAVPEGDE